MRAAFPVNLVLNAQVPAGRNLREHLVEQLRTAMLSGQMATHEPLPSTRALAAATGVSRGTIVAVYEELVGEGYVVVVPGSGTFVANDFPQDASSPRRPVSERAASEANSPEPEQSKVTVNLSPGSPTTGIHRSREWASAWRFAVRQELPGRLPDVAGEEEFRVRIADHLRVARRMQCATEDIVVTAGTSDGLGLLVQALREGRPFGTHIATENPGYPASRRVISRHGARPVPISVRAGGMDIEELARSEKPFAAALLTPSHQYPLGGRLPVAARLAMLDWASSTGAIIIEDDYDSEFRHGAPPLPSISSLDREQRVVLVGSFSKILSPWIRCGYLVIPDPVLRAQVLEIRDAMGQPVSGLLQSALSEFLHSGGLRRHLVRVGREYAHRRKLVIAATSTLAPRVRLNATEGGLHATLSWDAKGEPAEAITADLAARGINVASLRGYYHGPSEPDQHGIVFGYGAPTDLELRAALDAIRGAFARMSFD